MSETARLPDQDKDRGPRLARVLVARNYNTHRYADYSRDITPDDVFISWYSSAGNSWRAVVRSTVVRNLIWHVTFNKERGEAFIEICKRLNSVKLTREETHD